MRRVLADVRAFGVQFIRSRVGAFFAFAFPIILILLFGSIFSQSGTSAVPLYIQDLDATDISRDFVSALNETDVIQYRPIPEGADIQGYIRDNSINTALAIPHGFGDNVSRAQAGDPAARTVLSFYGDPTQSSYGIALSAVRGVATQFNFEIANTSQVVVTVPELLPPAAQFSFIDFFLPGVIGLTVLTSPLFGMTNVCADYRARKFFKFLATTKLTKGEWLAAKIVWYSLIMVASVAIMFAVERVVFGGSVAITPIAILIILAGTMEFTGLGMILGLYVRDVETAAAVANGIAFPMMFLGGSFFQIDAMPPALQTVAYLLPLTYVNEGLRATMVFGNTSTALTYLLITLALGVVFFIIPARALSWKSR